jgi:long-chain acyl-CoA synthetase
MIFFLYIYLYIDCLLYLSKVLEFLKIAVCCPILELYGQTECPGGYFITKNIDTVPGHVGGPTVNLEFKLEDVPEMRYTSDDKDSDGNLQPRGEICLRGPGVFAGYYKDSEKTAEAIQKGDWLHTGDIGVLLQNGATKIIDRKKNIFKLSQGEYVAPEKIENVYLRSEGVAEVLVHGESLQSCLVAIVVPDKLWVLDYAKSKGLKGEFKELIQSKEINQAILQNLFKQGKSEKLNGFEQVKAVHLEQESFMNIGILTPSFKIRRFNAKEHYNSVIQALYKSIS